MASNIYIKIEGIEGESKVEKYKDQIEALSFSYSCYQPVSEASGGDIRNAGRANHGTFNFSKYTDIATAGICKAMWSGKTIPSAVITVVDNNGDAVIERLTITLGNIVVCNFSLHGGGHSVADEEVSLSFSKIKVECHNQGKDGSAPGKNSAEWDLG